MFTESGQLVLSNARSTLHTKCMRKALSRSHFGAQFAQALIEFVKEPGNERNNAQKKMDELRIS